MLPINYSENKNISLNNLPKEYIKNLAGEDLKDKLTASGNTPAEPPSPSASTSSSKTIDTDKALSETHPNDEKIKENSEITQQSEADAEKPSPSANASASESSASAGSSENIDYEEPEFSFKLACTLAAILAQESHSSSSEVDDDENSSGNITDLIKELTNLSEAPRSDVGIKTLTQVVKNPQSDSEKSSPSANASASESSASAGLSENIDYDQLNSKVKFARIFAMQLAVKSDSASPLVYFDDKDRDLLANIMTLAEELEGLYADNPNDEKIKKLTQSAKLYEDYAIKIFLSMKKRGNPEMK